MNIFWPHILMVVREALDDRAALHLAAACGGQRRAVPDKAEGSALAAEVGIEIAKVLTASFARKTIYVPRGPDAFSVARDRRQVVAASPHKSANALAAELECSARRIEQIREDLRGGLENTQPSLF